MSAPVLTEGQWAALELARRREADPLKYHVPTKPQRLFHRDPSRFRILRGGNQSGKAQRNTEPVLTPTGWRQMGDLKVGDHVIGGDGLPCEVRGVFPQGVKPVFRVEFDDGAATHCTDDHLWRVLTPSARFRNRQHGYQFWSVMSLRQIREAWGDEPKAGYRVAIPAPEPARLESPNLPLHPYLLGVILGTGALHDGVKVRLASDEIRAEVASHLPPGVSLRRCGKRYQIVGDGRVNPVLSAVGRLNVGFRRVEMEVPEVYMTARVGHRHALVRGIRDGCGNGGDALEVASLTLAKQIQELVRSLGGKCYRRPGRRYRGERLWEVRISLTAHKQNRELRRVSPAGEAECTCIAVSSADQTYITTDYIVTHNTMCGAAELLYRMLGRHPHLETKAPPIYCRVITYSWDQSRTVSRKIWELLPKEELHPESSYHPDRGFLYHQFRLRNGSFCEIFTTRQGSIANASATLDCIWVDEPPPIELWSEFVARIMAKRGQLWLTMTPIGRPVGWLKDKVDAGEIKDHRFSVTAENCPWYTPEQIEEIEKVYLAFEVPQRIHGAWAGYLQERLFKGFSDDMIRDERPMTECQLGIGLDHGTDAGSQVAVLVAVDRSGEHPRCWVLDENVCDSTTTPEEDARQIIQMLRRSGMTLEHVDRWVGDRSHGGKRWGGAKSNRMLMAAFERELGLGIDRLPFRIHTVRKGRGSVWHGCRVIHAAMLRGDFVVHPRCKQLIESIQNWQGRSNSEFKHAIDALRYGSVGLMTKRPHNPGKVRIY